MKNETPYGGLSAVLDRHYRRESRRLPRLVLRRSLAHAICRSFADF